MTEIADRWATALLDAALASTAISGFVVLAMVQCRQPARRRAWARAGLVATLALFPLAALNPFPRIDLQGPLRSIFATDLDPPGPAVSHRQEPGHGPPDRLLISAEHHRKPPRWARWAGRGLLSAYLGGLSMGLGLLGLGIWGSSRLVGQARSPSTETLGLYGTLRVSARGTWPRLIVSAKVGRPVLLGIVRPSILIPPELDDPANRDGLRLGLLHELAHAEAADHVFGLIANLAQSLWFFVPPVWWIRDQMKLDQEFLADRRAVAHFGTTGHYASSLVELTSSKVRVDPEPAPSSTQPIPGGGMASALFQRVLMLLKCPFAIEAQTPLWWRWGTASTLILATLAASCLSFRGFVERPASTEPTGTEVRGSFRLPQLAIGQGQHDDQPFDLRFRLPEQFTLTLEVQAEPAELARLEVLGHKLGPSLNLEPESPAITSWHRVRIRRERNVEILEVDDHPVANSARLPRLATWLTIRPTPGKITRIRDLDLNW